MTKMEAGGSNDMKHTLLLLMTSAFILATATAISAQNRLTFTGTAIIYGTGMNIRTTTRTFTMRINGTTSEQEIGRYLNTLQERGQRSLLDAMSHEDLGTFALGGRAGSTLRAVHIDQAGNRQRVRAVFDRWIGFGEFREGYRSLDYPFSYVEILVDPRTGRGEGTFIPAAQIRFRNKNGQQLVEIEDFGTFPGRLMGVTMRGRLPL